MKKYLSSIILGVIIVILAVAIGSLYFSNKNKNTTPNPVETSEPVATATPESTPTVEPTAETTEAPHEHVYTETVTTEATCEAEGLKTFTCDCGDSYTEVISAKGHSFKKYVYNEDATYLADGTMTSTCERCDSTKTATAINTQLKYTFTLIDKTMYAQQSVNVRDLPCAEGEKVGSLSTNEEVWVFMQCVETGWYEIVGDSITGYVSNNYLDTEKVVTQQETTPNSSTPTAPSNSSFISDRCGYKIGQVYGFDAYEMKYLGEDRWYDEWNQTYYTAIPNSNGGFDLRTDEYLSRVYAKEGETPVSERLGYQPGDYIVCYSLGFTFNRIYEGNDIWYDDNDPNYKMRAYINSNGEIGFDRAD